MKFTVIFRTTYKQIGTEAPEEITPEPISVEGDRIVSDGDGVLIVRDQDEVPEHVIDFGHGVAWFATDLVRAVVPVEG